MERVPGMRTRRSPKNQDRLWKALAGKNKVNPPVTSIRCWDCVSYPKGGRGRGECVLIGEIVMGRNENRPCFISRKK